MKNVLYALAFILLPTVLSAQSAEFVDDFNDNVLAAHWKVSGSTFALTETGGVLNVAYARNGSDGSKWDQFHLDGVSVNVDAHPYLAIDIKSSVAFELAVKPVSTRGDEWLVKNIPGDNAFHTYVIELHNVIGAPVTQVYIYFDGGSTSVKSGSVQFDNFKLGYHYTPPVITTYLQEAIDAATKLKAFIIEGTNLEQFPAGSKNKIDNSITNANSVLVDASSKSQAEIDEAMDVLYDVLMEVESSIKLSDKGLIDAKATKETTYLYNNLKHLASNKTYLFGMHDATAYGINQNGSSWTDDGSASKSDIKAVTGSHPAVFSQDVYDIVDSKLSLLTNYRNRQCKAYAEGGVITLVWHMADPVNKSFYWDNISPAYNVVASILPGGVHHEWYKVRLQRLASYVKGLRGANGEAIPVIFRPFHEHNGNWFWWGKTRCTVSEYNALWKFTVEHIRDELNVHNFIYAYSPDGNQYNTKTEYLSIYPGDNYVDILGLDYYFGDNNTSARDKLRDRLTHAVEYADEKKKVAALCEFGDRLGWDDVDKLEIDNFYTKMISGAVKGSSTSARIAYAATWRNANPNHHFAPYPGHKEVNDFITYYNDPTTIFLDNVPDLYTALLAGAAPTSIASAPEMLTLYPNPTTDSVYVKASEGIKELIVFNSKGQVVKRMTVNNKPQADISLKGLPKGVYHIKIMMAQPSKTVIRKVVRE